MVERKMIYLNAYGFSYANGGYHTKKDFLRSVQDLHWDKLYTRRNGDKPGVPVGKFRRDDIKSWMKLVGAVYKTRPHPQI